MPLDTCQTLLPLAQLFHTAGHLTLPQTTSSLSTSSLLLLPMLHVTWQLHKARMHSPTTSSLIQSPRAACHLSARTSSPPTRSISPHCTSVGTSTNPMASALSSRLRLRDTYACTPSLSSCRLVSRRKCTCRTRTPTVQDGQHYVLCSKDICCRRRNNRKQQQALAGSQEASAALLPK